MKPLTTQELSQARADVAAALLTEPVAVSRRAEVRDSSGGFSATYATVWTGLGRYAPSSAAETALANRMNYTTSVTITLPAEVSVLPDDRVSVGGRVYEVFAVLGRRTTEIVTRVLAAEVL